MIPVSRPIAGSENEIGCLPQAGTRFTRIARPQSEETLGKPVVTMSLRRRGSERSQFGKLYRKASIVGDVEAEHDGSGSRRALDHVQAHRSAVPAQQQMLAGGISEHPCAGLNGVECVVALFPDPSRPDGEHARVDDR